MSEVVIYTRAPRAAIRRVLLSLPQRVRAGGVVQDATLSRAGTALLHRIQEAFAVKSQGGTDAAGENWKPLSPRTIAYRRAKRTRAESRRAAHPSQALTKKQQERWRAIFRAQLKKFPRDMSGAAKVAWAVLRSEGSHTLLDKYGTQKVDILRDTGELMESLTPNSGSARSVFRVLPGQVEVGTSRPHALAHHLGVPQIHLPQRRLWPAPRKWPDAWWGDILLEVQTGVVELVVQTIVEVT